MGWKAGSYQLSGPTQLPIQWVAFAVALRMRWQGFEAGHLLLLPSSRIAEWHVNSPIHISGMVCNYIWGRLARFVPCQKFDCIEGLAQVGSQGRPCSISNHALGFSLWKDKSWYCGIFWKASSLCLLEWGTAGLESHQSSPYHHPLLRFILIFGHPPTSLSQLWSSSFWISYQYLICIPHLSCSCSLFCKI
jgi:hypothetical protein